MEEITITKIMITQNILSTILLLTLRKTALPIIPPAIPPAIMAKRYTGWVSGTALVAKVKIKLAA